MKKIFVIQIEYPDNDVISSEEIMEVAQECIEHSMERYFGANIMDGDYDRIKVKEVTDFIALVKRMREAQEREAMLTFEEDEEFVTMICVEARKAERKVDEYLMKMEE